MSRFLLEYITNCGFPEKRTLQGVDDKGNNHSILLWTRPHPQGLRDVSIVAIMDHKCTKWWYAVWPQPRTITDLEPGWIVSPFAVDRGGPDQHRPSIGPTTLAVYSVAGQTVSKQRQLLARINAEFKLFENYLEYAKFPTTKGIPLEELKG